MFGLGFFEIIILAVILLVFVGPSRLPEVMRQGGKLFVQLRRTANDVKSTFDGVIREAEDEVRKVEREKFMKLFEENQQTPTTPEPPPDYPEHQPPHHHVGETPPESGPKSTLSPEAIPRAHGFEPIAEPIPQEANAPVKVDSSDTKPAAERQGEPK
jgi:sec-independent protein translocase protein TatB